MSAAPFFGLIFLSIEGLAPENRPFKKWVIDVSIASFTSLFLHLGIAVVSVVRYPFLRRAVFGPATRGGDVGTLSLVIEPILWVVHALVVVVPVSVLVNALVVPSVLERGRNRVNVALAGALPLLFFFWILIGRIR